ncbi:oxidoreductase [Thermococcus litoralis DSM 5473]|uniref:Oxidoreductase n=1 Tax=Thermococcus litoralis (strain ATCC 51850 / DSM 5473 / JCM 8560 / NS-C) TaxID=523849 RepID=H3ZPN8_THELN|nr:SDR family NAD(P)-dependent oxidoreductase [Thermococcus litoralis]EHR78082.1 oxidoreductase [Thermococcus litoralis DSM 5473]
MLAVVTGASRGIGRLLVERLIKKGYQVVGIARSREALEELKARFGDSFEYVVQDLAQNGAEREVKKALERLGVDKVDLLINNAGFAVKKPLLEHGEEELQKLFRVLTISPVLMTKELLPLMQSGSKVVMVLSGVAFVRTPEIPAYGAAKAALHYLSLTLSEELRENGIKVIRVYPKQVATPFWDKTPKGAISPEQVADAIIKAIENGREEVFVPGYIKVAKYLPRWPALTYRFEF